MKKTNVLFALLLTTLYSSPAFARVYRDKPVGHYATSYDLRDYNGTFLSFMKEEIYPAIAQEAFNISGSSRDFLGAIERGEGVEIRLTDDVSTVHVKYKNPHDSDNPERSGRSFGLVGHESGTYHYVADASYSHFLKSLEKLSFGSDKELEDFYRAILYVLADCNTKYMSALGLEAKKVAADFVAVYVAEQYRHLINGRDRDGDEEDLGIVSLGRGHNWDDAHLQVTLLAAFHGGQSKEYRYMVYEGELTNSVFDQNTCLYRRFDESERNSTEKRSIQLYDYWQFSYRSDCPGRSGVNITRSEFQEMGKLMTDTLGSTFESDTVVNLARELEVRTSGNLIKEIAEFFVNDTAPEKLPNGGKKLVEAIVDFIMESHRFADDITRELVIEE